MQTKFYIIIQGKQPKFGPHKETRREPGAIRIAKNKPNTNRDEIAVKVGMEIPDSLFIKPTLEANIRVPESEKSGPVITADVAENISDIIREQIGVELHISCGETDE